MLKMMEAKASEEGFLPITICFEEQNTQETVRTRAKVKVDYSNNLHQVIQSIATYLDDKQILERSQ